MSDVKTWRYHFRNDPAAHEGWAILFLDSIGCFSALSDYGNYAHRWQEEGWGKYDFRLFVLKADDGYILNKLTMGCDVYRSDETVASIKKEIIEKRRAYAERWRGAHLTPQGGWNKYKARKEWDLLVEEYGGLDTREDFAIWCTRSELDEPWGHFCEGPSARAEAFVKKVMPRLRQRLVTDLIEEGLLPAGDSGKWVAT